MPRRLENGAVSRSIRRSPSRPESPFAWCSTNRSVKPRGCFVRSQAHLGVDAEMHEIVAVELKPDDVWLPGGTIDCVVRRRRNQRPIHAPVSGIGAVSVVGCRLSERAARYCTARNDHRSGRRRAPNRRALGKTTRLFGQSSQRLARGRHHSRHNEHRALGVARSCPAANTATAQRGAFKAPPCGGGSAGRITLTQVAGSTSGL
jgi:hypothetical protein